MRAASLAILYRPQRTALQRWFAQASFWAPLNDLGNGEVNLALARGTGSAAFTRATTAWTKLSTGLWAEIASGTARSFYGGFDTAAGSYLSYRTEGARTNSCLHARDLTNASWIKVTMATAKTSTGIDGAANSCTRCTASAANATALQSIVLASAAKTFSVWIKRVTGTGTINITLDAGVTWTDVTASINSTTFTRVSATQTLANPTVGIRIVTDTDAVDVDMCQLEDNASFATTPIPTTTVAVTRNADVLAYPLTGNLSLTEGTCYAETLAFNTDNFPRIVGSTVSGDGAALYIQGSTNKIGIFDVTVERVSTNTIVDNTAFKASSAWGSLTSSIALDGTLTSELLFDGNLNLTDIAIGTAFVSEHRLFGAVKNVRIWTRKPPNYLLQRSSVPGSG